MSLDLNVLKKDLDSTYGDWEVFYGEEDSPKVCKFKYLLRVSAKRRKKFWSLIRDIALINNGDEETLEKEAFATGEQDFHEYLVVRIKEVLAALAVDKASFNDFTKACGTDFQVWDHVLSAYAKHYGVLQGESSPSQNS